jgi:hypothetical protein
MIKYNLSINEIGDDITKLFSSNKLLLSKGYTRIVIGGRGPYVELNENQICLSSFHIPKDQLYRLTDKRIYYVEMRSIDNSYVKLYYQLKTVAYADYKIGMFYISPLDLYDFDGKCIITANKIENEKANKFFA